MSWEILGPDKLGQLATLPSAHHLGMAHVLFPTASSKIFLLHSGQLPHQLVFEMLV